ncbi:MAG: radical SAM protein [Candidatus Eisenbacteria bacterium]|nr:radical SAM protein [Candidatus Eisenbacteria bacterium]
MATCQVCGENSLLVAQVLSVCRKCILKRFPDCEKYIREAHHKRRDFGLEPEPPRHPDGAECRLCANHCRMAKGSFGYCGVRENRDGKVRQWMNLGCVSWYFDSLPTNCVAGWVCPGGTEAGYPDYSYSPGPEYGYKNLAVFYEACNFDCLFCQNWHFRLQSRRGELHSARDLANSVDHRTSCICFFGGDPTPQLPHAIHASRLAMKEASGSPTPRMLRICWETNGGMHPSLAKKMMEISLKTGGCVKFDLKAVNERIHIALCGVSNKTTLHNFRTLSSFFEQRPDPPPLVASTLLVPGYVDEEEVAAIAGFIAELNPDIPYSLLAFNPHFLTPDLPSTSRRHAERARNAALAQGLTRVRVGNLQLLDDTY